ncbi:hypothetical protein MMC11_003577 [Xylographa trunciseda]|nr:hypothetical protein [Xylographa trunciseda]
MARAVGAVTRVDTLRVVTRAEAMAEALMGTICPQMAIIDTITTITIAAEAGQGMFFKQIGIFQKVPHLMGQEDMIQPINVDGDFYKTLTSPTAREILLLGDRAPESSRALELAWFQRIADGIDNQLKDSKSSLDTLAIKQEILEIGIAALHTFLQSNVTGPPLDRDLSEAVSSAALRQAQPGQRQEFRRQLIRGLSVDGEAAYALTPHVEFFCLAKAILTHKGVVNDNTDARWQRLRLNFWHQRMLSDVAPTLQMEIYDDLDLVERALLSSTTEYTSSTKTQFLLERAAIHTYHGFDAKAREDLDRAAKLTGLEYVLTGRLGKRTKFQQNELSQLVVLARSSDSSERPSQAGTNGHADETIKNKETEQARTGSKPQNLDLNDDTLLESIAFSNEASPGESIITESIPPSLAALDPANQPILKPLDSIILLSLASSITNTSPQHGLTREETLPYATRVLEGGSTNWQIYTQALLVRSRIEGYRSRTVERGVLQLQALVDQVIAETTPFADIPNSIEATDASANTAPSTFLPRPKPSESASVTERLQYIHQLASPTRWVLEAELAARWVSLGGLRTALEIYERLEMWSEAALCWAAVEREDKARRIVRRQLYQSKRVENAPSGPRPASLEEDTDEYLGDERVPLPIDAPRLFCILGDLEKSSELYERAWTVSGDRYARAQRSLGKYYLTTQELSKADDAYSKSLKINPQNQSTWFALGCVRLELRDWKGAVEAFSRAVQIEEGDAETWSNLAAALLRLPPDQEVVSESLEYINDVDGKPQKDPQKHAKEAFVALKRAAALKRESYRIWQNLLNVSATLSPPPYADIIIAQERLIELRGTVEGESCVDIEVLEGLLAHVIASAPPRAFTRPEHAIETSPAEQQRKRFGLEHMFIDLIQKHVTPLITHSRRLWQLVAKLSLHLNRPSSALEAYEKAWRTTQNNPGWESGADSAGDSNLETAEQAWNSVVDATIELVDAYESLGEKERTEGLAAGTGELVCKDWKFKSRSAIRGVMGKAKERWEDSSGWERLKEHLASLRTT